ncbi:hypothetical protein BFW01_g7693 [Lasiodiplodia theobromae]|nr:hypothetical protein BFW01_g7693 [Lasiodiplodia theobromae]
MAFLRVERAPMPAASIGLKLSITSSTSASTTGTSTVTSSSTTSSTATITPCATNCTVFTSSDASSIFGGSLALAFLLLIFSNFLALMFMKKRDAIKEKRRQAMAKAEGIA